jgi:hypothetical protein
VNTPPCQPSLLRRAAWAAWIVAAVIGAMGTRHYRVHNSMDDWMPDLSASGPYASYLVIGFSSEKADATTVAARLRQLPTVQFCLDPATVGATEPITGISPDDIVIGRDRTYVGVFCFRRSSADDRAFVAQVRSALDGLAAPDTFALGGPAAFQQAMDRWCQERLGLILGSIFIGGGCVLFLVTGSTRLAAVAMAAIACSQLIFIGALCWLRIPIDMSLALVPPMMMGLGLSYAAHRALRRQSLGVLIACGIAAAAGIASFISADLRPVRHFAIAGVPGLLLVWAAVVTLVRPNRAARRRRVPWLRGLRNACLAAVTRYRRAVIATAVVISVGGAVLSGRLHVEENPLNFFPPTSRVVLDFGVLNRRLTGMLPSQVIIHGGTEAIHGRDLVAMLLATPGMRKVIDVTPWVGDGRSGSGADAVGGDETYWCLADDDAVHALARHVPAWRDWVTARGARLGWHGVAAQIDRSGASLFQTAEASLPSMAGLVALIIGVRLRRLRPVWVGTWVAILPVATLVLTAVAARWALGPVSMMIGSIAVGVAVDDVLHLLITFRRRRGRVAQTMIECWRPCVGSSLATALAFGLFMLSPFGPMRQFGVLMALATCYAMLANQFLVPALLMPVAGRRERHGSPLTAVIASAWRRCVEPKHIVHWLGSAVWLALAAFAITLWLHRANCDSMNAGHLSAWANETHFTVSYSTWLAPGKPPSADFGWQWRGASFGRMGMDFVGRPLQFITLQVPHWMVFTALAIPPALWGGWWLARSHWRRRRGFDVQPSASSSP